MTVNGHKIRYISFGSGADIVFLHGWGASISAFLFVAKRFCATNRVTLIDFAGFGESEEPLSVYTVADYASDVLAVLDKIGVKNAVFIGHSFGGRVCLELAARHSHIVRAIVLIDSAGLKPRRGIKYYVKVGLHKLLRRLGLAGLKGSADFRVLSPIMQATFKAVVNYDQTPLLKDIKCPTAIFWGKDDKDTPLFMAHKLEKRIADSSLFWLNGGHFSYADDVGKFLTILRAFIFKLMSN